MFGNSVRLEIRRAASDDLGFLTDVFNHYVRTSTCIWRETEITLEDRQRWLNDRDPRHPVLIATRDGTRVGYAALGPFRPFPGYRDTAELAIYIAPAHHRRGIGRALMTALIAAATEHRLTTLIGAVSADQEPSLALHRACGFHEVGRLPGIGLKHGRRLNLVLMQRSLA